MKPAIWPASIALIAAYMTLPARAELGGDIQSIQADRLRMQATRTDASAGSDYTVHEMRMPSGTVVREYAGANGKVFAVTWEGPAQPKLDQLLGPYFDQYSEAAQEVPAGQRQAMIRQPGFVLQSSGHMRTFSGKAYLPDLLPQGVAAEDLQ
ncbi:DUF2844 domain-containing protein [Noviherbaspirillum massiliense]|uniref:DUF2844 domain-containing protein n=1 Tax=Noviherbaspirillum massiliense TaxID=1465823 RepID=UPI0003190559|nr:DUF2844 domain-containing protein [Noviherbaspirillum massiliense]